MPVLPEPVPVVMHVVGVELIDDRRTAPQIPVQIGRGIRDRFLEANAAARLAAVAVRDFQLAKLARLNGFMQTGDSGIAATLRAVLNHDAVLLLRFDRDAPFGHIVAHRFFDIDVLAGLSGPDRHQRMPVVRRRDGDGVEVLVFQRFAHVGDSFRLKVFPELRLKALHGELPVPFCPGQ